MLPNTSQSRSHRPVFGGSWLLWRGLIVALATLSIITGLGISELTARSGIEPSGGTVNRILKGDRSPLAFRIQPNAAHRLRQTNTPLETARDYQLAANPWLVRSRILSWHASQAVACRSRQSICQPVLKPD